MRLRLEELRSIRQPENFELGRRIDGDRQTGHRRCECRRCGKARSGRRTMARGPPRDEVALYVDNEIGDAEGLGADRAGGTGRDQREIGFNSAVQGIQGGDFAGLLAGWPKRR